MQHDMTDPAQPSTLPIAAPGQAPPRLDNVPVPEQTARRRMKFSWMALVLAPLPIPAVYSALLEMSAPGRSPVYAFLFFFVVGSVLCYGATIFLLLPCLFLVSRVTRLTAFLTCLTGTVLGLVVYLPLTWIDYNSSGVDSGPPEGTFAEYFRRHCFEVDFWACLLAGLVTAMVYWFLANRASRSSEPPAP